uniref:Uncharacterized protein n=1 Tax=Megaselia scalaris TaxID=36166 RepID=T1GTJ4_MEGSC
MKSEMINKLALPDLMETILAEKNEEIDHLKEQLESKEKELQSIFEIENLSQKSHREDDLGKSSARTLSDIVSISEYSEPDVMRRAHLPQESPLVLPDNQNLTTTMDTSKEAVANLTEKRTSDLNVFANLHPASTFDNPHYFQDPSVPIQGINSSSLITSAIAPRKINFSHLTDDSRKAEADETVDFIPSTSSNNHQINFISTSPPCRDNAGHRQSAFTLKSPALISECEQKFDWSRLKKP